MKNFEITGSQEMRDAIGKAIRDIATLMLKQKDVQDEIKEGIKALEESTGIPSKMLRKAAKTVMNGDYDSQVNDSENFQHLYEFCVRGDNQ